MERDRTKAHVRPGKRHQSCKCLNCTLPFIFLNHRSAILSSGLSRAQRKYSVSQWDLKYNMSLYTSPRAVRTEENQSGSVLVKCQYKKQYSHRGMVDCRFIFPYKSQYVIWGEIVTNEAPVIQFLFLGKNKTPHHGCWIYHLCAQESSNQKFGARGERKSQNTKLFIETNSEQKGKYLVSSAANSRRCWSSP